MGDLTGGVPCWRSAANMFLPSAHREADIDAALEAASRGFKAVRELATRVNR